LELRANGYRDIDAPVFFLSTGRCGTKFCSLLLSEDRHLIVLHAPEPRLTVQAPLAYSTMTEPNRPAPGSPAWDCLREVFAVAREQYVVLAYQSRKRLVETNNSVTFFAPVIAELFPSARFVHLHRHPGEVVRSGIRRGWYTGSTLWDLGRPAPRVHSPEHSSWRQRSSIEKIGWLWRETNEFIEAFKTSQPPERVFTLSTRELSMPGVLSLVDFVRARISRSRLERWTSAKTYPNRQQRGEFPPFDEWTSREKDQLREVCGGLASHYNYSL